ncbi:hypothetical protein [Streptomyces ardesiacus]
MNKVYKRTENGVTGFVSQREGLAEINHAMMDGKRDVRTMSSVTRTDYGIEYKDGRSVRLTLIDAPAPEGFTQGQAVVVQRPGQAPITGTVAHIHTAPSYLAVMDDRHRAVANYPTSFVSAVETGEGAEEEPAEAAPDAEPKWSVASHRMLLHRFTEDSQDGRALCNKSFRPHRYANGYDFQTRTARSSDEYGHLYTYCPRCDAK